MRNSDIPQIDLSPFCSAPFYTDADFPSTAQRAVAAEIDASFRRNGFLVASNFGPSLQDVNDMFAQTRSLFSMSREKKSELFAFDPKLNCGYFPEGMEFLNERRAPDIKEMFNFRNPKENVNQFQNTPPSFKLQASKFSAIITKSAVTFAVALALALGLDSTPDFFLDAMRDAEKSVFRLIHYPPCEFVSHDQFLNNPNAAIRTGEHTDFGLFTILFSDGPGLQVSGDGDGEWKSAPVAKFPAAIVNSGALLARWTNDRWRATPHRVVAETKEQANTSRISVVYFVNARNDTIVETDKRFLGEGEVAKYEKTTAGDYFKMRMYGSLNVDGKK